MTIMVDVNRGVSQRVRDGLNGNKVQFDENKVQFERRHKFRSMPISK